VEADPDGAAPSTRALREFSVLVVDDEKDSRALMTHYLEEFGCNVITASGGEEGLAKARQYHPDLITLDLMMPGMTGWEVLRRLKDDPELRAIPVVVVSIVANEGRGRLLGAVDLVTKPFEREDLLRVFWRNLVRKREGRILVVEDDVGDRTLIESLLGSLGLEVVTAENGRTALELIRVEAPDAVLLDLVMPVMDGMEFLNRLRSNPLHRGLPVVILTAKDLTREQLMELGDMASGVVKKGPDMGTGLTRTLGSMFALRAKDPEVT
jgi:CheY-like chemotaxis protein